MYSKNLATSPQKVYYFAYSFYMNEQNLLNEGIIINSAQSAFVDNYDITFYKSKNKEKKYITHLMPLKKNKTEGILYEIFINDFNRILDKNRNDYQAISVTAKTRTNSISAFTFIGLKVENKKKVKPDLHYLSHLLKAKKYLTTPYIQFLKSIQTEVCFVFVYGSLKKGFGNHKKWMKNTQFICNAVTKGYYALYRDPLGFPHLKEDEAKYQIKGELYQISSQKLIDLDLLEEEGELYERKIILVYNKKQNQQFRAWIYFSKEVKGEIIHDCEYFNKNYQD